MHLLPLLGVCKKPNLRGKTEKGPWDGGDGMIAYSCDAYNYRVDSTVAPGKILKIQYVPGEIYISGKLGLVPNCNIRSLT